MTGKEQHTDIDAQMDDDVTEASGTDAQLSAEEVLAGRVKELEDQLLRSAAEFENFKKRNARMYEDMMKAANDRLIGELLDVVDNFDRALHHAQNDSDPTAVVKGTELIFGQLQSLLAKEGITPVDSLGKPFDPKLHDAIMEMESDEYPEGIVAMEMNKAYMQGDRVLRHAKVAVSKGPKEGK